MSLSNLTTSGWVLFALTLIEWLAFVVTLVQVARGMDVKKLVNPVIIVGALTAWLLWLVTP